MFSISWVIPTLAMDESGYKSPIEITLTSRMTKTTPYSDTRSNNCQDEYKRIQFWIIASVYDDDVSTVQWHIIVGAETKAFNKWTMTSTAVTSQNNPGYSTIQPLLANEYITRANPIELWTLELNKHSQPEKSTE